MINTQGKFYLGRLFDPEQGLTTRQPLEYDPLDLTTHAVVVGMTGSGKTGLCIDLIEEAALQGIPALMIDPKGDITNCLLHFPDLLPQDFLPWVNAEQARRQGKTLEQAAAQYAEEWKKGLAEWGISQERLRALKNAAQYAVFTPGSDAGIPVNVLTSLKVPVLRWEENRELLRAKISDTVTALLGLVGLKDIDPVRSREHILLSNIFEASWSRGKDLNLGELILQTQNPPFTRLGVFEINAFFPEKARFELAALLNNLLAAPSFQSWVEGQPLEITDLLFTPNGLPRHNVFYLAHLSDAERMFFVTLLFSALETWMRSQSGAAALRAIVYFDEIFGYLPPVGNPPSKPLMLRMLKQARAFGVGQVYATQNPVDIDYKALSNAGTWFIGKLQTERDKERLLDGLDSTIAGGLDRSQYDRLISNLGKRVFILHNVHAKQPVLFQTRWAMNFLAGPLTSAQIPLLNQMAGATLTSAPKISQAELERPRLENVQTPSLEHFQAVPVETVIEEEAHFQRIQPAVLHIPELSATRPAIPVGIAEYFLPIRRSLAQALQIHFHGYPDEAFVQEIFYRPGILGQAVVRFLNRRLNLDHILQKAVLVNEPVRKGTVRWERFVILPLAQTDLDDAPVTKARFALLEEPFSDAKTMAALQKEFVEWVYRTSQVVIRAQETLKIYAGPQVTQAKFRQMVSEAARQRRDQELQKALQSFDRRIEALKARLRQEERELSEDQIELSQRRLEEMGTHAENLLGLFSKRRSRRLSTSLTKRRLTEQAKAEVEESQEAIEEYQQRIAELESERDSLLAQINDRWGRLANEITEITVAPLRKDILIDYFGIAWMPYYVVRVGQQVIELPGFAQLGA